MTLAMDQSTGAMRAAPADIEQRDFDAFYATHYGRLVLQLYAYVGDLHEAQDLVQEAFCRALSKWKALAGFDEPVAWVRRVAWNLATSRFRKQRTALNFLRQQRHEERIEGPSPDRVALAKALAAIPAQQRRAVVLHYVARLSVAEIAAQDGVAEGTVKSRLSRGRVALGELLAETLDDFVRAAAPSVQVTGTAAVRATVKHRRKVRLTAFSVLAVLFIAVSVAAFAARPRGGSPAVTESPSVTPPASPSPSAPDGRLTAEQLIASGAEVPAWADASSGCATQVGAKSAAYEGPRKPYLAKAVHTNLDDDAAIETAALVYCTHIEGHYWQVVGYDRSAAGAVASLGPIVPSIPGPIDVVDLAIRPGAGIIITVSLDYGDPGVRNPPNQQREYAWNGGAFVQVGGPVSFPAEETADLALTVSALALGPAQNGTRSGTVTVTVTNNGPNESGTFYVSIGRLGMTVSPLRWVSTPHTGGQPVQEHAPLAAGRSDSITVTLTVPESAAGTTITATCYGSGVTDSDQSNNYEIRIPLG